MKTAEEILKKRIPVNGFINENGDADYSRDECILAMEEYASQFKTVEPEKECKCFDKKECLEFGCQKP